MSIFPWRPRPVNCSLRSIVAGPVLALLLGGCGSDASSSWTANERAKIVSLALPAAVPVAAHGNGVADDHRAAAFGHLLFFDKRLSGNGEVACASCHRPEHGFSDNRSLSRGMGTTGRHTPTVIGAANSAWQFWDGRADSLWAQALGPLENPDEHGANRMQLARLMTRHYREQYQTVFGALPSFDDASRFPGNAMPAGELGAAWQAMSEADRHVVNEVFANIGKSLAAYQALLMPGPSRFDDFARAVGRGEHSTALSPTEQAGLKLFISEQGGQCLRCHNGPLMTNHDFQVTGIDRTSRPGADGRLVGIRQALDDPFNCQGRYSDSPAQCDELVYAKREGMELRHAFKVPTLRNIARTAPYMHDGGMATLGEVLRYYNQAPLHFADQPPGENAVAGGAPTHLDIEPLRLLPHQLNQLEAFLHTLDSPPAVDGRWLRSPFSSAGPTGTPSPARKLLPDSGQDRNPT